MTDHTKPVRVNVGTIGHVDHGKTTLTRALVEVLGAEMASRVVVVDGSEIPVECLTEIEYGPHRNERYWAKRRKKERKSRLTELQRKAFEGGRRP